MLGIVIDGTTYPVIEAGKLLDYAEANGIETDWWVERANVISLEAGLGPSTAHLLLPYSTVRLLNPPPTAPTYLGGGSTGDELGLTAGDDADDTSPTDGDGAEGGGSHSGANFYDRTIRVFQMLRRFPAGHGHDEPYLEVRCKDLEGWIFVESQAIDSQLDPTALGTIHLARFVDIRGAHELVPGAFSSNINLVDKVQQVSGDYDQWGFFNDPLLDPLENDTAWPNISELLWGNIALHYPNSKYEVFNDTFDYPYFPVLGDDPMNNRPHNLLFKDMNVWEAFVAYVHKISHEVFPTHAGLFTFAPIDSHTEESTTWITSTTDPQRGLKLQFGEELWSRKSYLIDHDHPPTIVIVPHSFTAAFTKTLGTNEQLAVLPICLWRGTGNTLEVGSLVPIEEGSLFTQELVKDTTKFPAQFLTDHPYILAGDYLGENGTDRAARTRTQYVDCTFFAVPTTAKEGLTLNIDDADDGLRTNGETNVYPAPDIGRLISKRHLKCQLFGDLGSVVLSGLHDFLPSSRHQTVILDCGVEGPTTTLIGKYVPWSPLPRKVTTRNLDIINTGEYEGLAVVESLTPVDYDSEPAQSGSIAGLDYSMASVVGTAFPLEWDASDNLIIPVGAIAVEFRIIRDDTLINTNTIIFIKNRVGHAVSAGDYIRFFPNDTTDPTEDRVLVRQASTNRLVWATGENFVGPPGPGGGGGGDSVVAGYAIDTDGTGTVTIHNDPTEWTGNADTYQFFRHLTGDLATRTGPHWKSVTNFDNAENQMIWHQSDTWAFKTTTDYAGSNAAPQFLLNCGAGNGGDWLWKSASGYNAGLKQLLFNNTNTWQWDYFVGYDKVTIKVPTSITLAIVGTVLRATINYSNFEVIGKDLGTVGEIHGDILITAC